jgi:DNA-binding IclR family transcriptional regulator
VSTEPVQTTGQDGSADIEEPSSEDILTRRFPEAPYGYTAGSIHRGLEILELFAVEQTPLTVGTIASKLGYPQSSTSVLLRGLTELGYLEHDRVARTFQPTLRVTFLGMWLHQGTLAQGSLLEFMERLASASGHVALLGMQNGLYAQYVHIVAARSSRVGLKPGLLRSICRSAVGKVLLSSKTDDEVRRIVRNANAVDTHYPSPVDAEALLHELAECRSTGWAETCNSITQGSAVIATCVPISSGGVPLAVGIGVTSTEVEELRPFIRDLIRETITKYFGSDNHSSGAARTRVFAPQTSYAVRDGDTTKG